MSTASATSPVHAANQFSLDLYARLRDQSGNLFFSPYSVAVALAMTSAGARGRTAEEMARVLHAPAEPDRLHRDVAGLTRQINGSGEPRPYQLHTANALWGQKGFGFLPDFLALTQRHYGAGLHEVDFSGASEQARRTINAWVESQTNDRIKELLKPSSVSAATRLVLTNAVYFKGNWHVAFPREATREGAFHVAPGKAVDAPLMHLSSGFRYHDAGSLQVLEMPYEGGATAEEAHFGGGDLSMLVLLPRAHDGLAELERSLTVERLESWRPRHWQEVDLTLPRFRATRDFDLVEPLSGMGMRSAFDAGSADFSGMTGRRDLFVSAVVHQAFVNVDEQGTEAAAATGVAMTLSAMPVEPPVFRADHPFLFLIRHNPTGAILFLGRLVNPGE